MKLSHTCLVLGLRPSISFSPKHSPTFFSILSPPSHGRKSLIRVSAKQYGRGSEIYPLTNEGSISLEDSFPNGIIPSSTISLLQTTETNDAENENSTATFDIEGASGKNPLSSQERSDEFETSSTAPMKFPASIVLFLVLSGQIPVSLIIFTMLFSGYIISLSFIAASRMNRINEDLDFNNDVPIDRPILPSLPPQGHVPYLLANPLGMMFSRSATYRRWLKLGTTIGFFGPLIATCWYRYRMKNLLIGGIIAQNLYLICCQAMSEQISKRAITPLPIRILIPLAYNSFRIGKLYEWVMLPMNMGYVGRILAISNFAYWTVNLFGFLIPVASLRYLRSHFFCVEAAEVTFRSGEGRRIGLY